MKAELENFSKADLLDWLKPKLKDAYVEDLLKFSVKDWEIDSGSILKDIVSFFPASQKLVVRSSSLHEDGAQESKAGYFHSELNVAIEENAIIRAVNKVVDSYKKLDVQIADNLVLIQSQTENILLSGVVFTRQLETNAPYYVINYDTSGKTDTVTGGCSGQVEFISHFRDLPDNAKWYLLIKAVKEIEALFKDTILDIEFAVTKDNKIVIFQVRPLAANYRLELPDDNLVKTLIEDMGKKFILFTKPVPYLGGDFNIMGDMPDWNPSEIIGARPNTLDYTLYSFIVTDEVWHESRSTLGYYDVYPAELMLSFGKKPYIDTRNSFNSLIPANIAYSLREKLMNYYLTKLKNNPASQDKVEFEILWTCYDFSLAEEIKVLLDYGFTQIEVDELSKSLKGLTNNILISFKDIMKDDLEKVKFLTERLKRIKEFLSKKDRTPWNLLHNAYNILQNCKKFGTLPFAREARLAFIAKSFLMSLKKKGVISLNDYHNFLNSIRTVASDFNDDFYRLQDKQITKSCFFEKYGHLRAGTYDITAPRYDSYSDLFDEAKVNDLSVISNSNFLFEDDKLTDIQRLLTGNGLMIKVDDFLCFVKLALENREYAKFEFTRSLSEALELIAEAGELLGFQRDELCHADLPTLMKFKNPEHGDIEYARKIIKQSIDRHKKERGWYDAVILPPVITSEDDFYHVIPYNAVPNFITDKIIEGEIINFEQIKNMEKHVLTGKIVVLENADPGFDWIFTKKPLGLITKYGGVASHMAIRCAEFRLPAAIGCGDIIYNNLKDSKKVLLDCDRKLIKTIGY